MSKIIQPSYTVFALTYEEQRVARGLWWCAVNYSMSTEEERIKWETKMRQHHRGWIGHRNKYTNDEDKN